MTKTHKLQLQAVSAAVARLLREEREKRALSMSAVAERAGLSQQMVSYVERELRKPTLDTLMRMTLALDVELPGLIEQAYVEGKRRAK